MRTAWSIITRYIPRYYWVLLFAVFTVLCWFFINYNKSTRLTDIFDFTLVDIPAGTFVMGSSIEEELEHRYSEPQHLVHISYPFKIGKCEVTQGQWYRVMRTTVSDKRDEQQRLVTNPNSNIIERLRILAGAIIFEPKKVLERGLWNLAKWIIGRYEVNPWPIRGEGDNYPMFYVNYYEANEFCAKLTKLAHANGRLPQGHEYRLPTEEEWEYACRAGSTTRFANGNDDSNLNEMGWYSDNSDWTTHPVGMKHPNGWGLYDMHGNVEEWCKSKNDCIIRGGTWISISSGCTSSYGEYRHPKTRSHTIGFRVVLGPSNLKAQSE